MSKILVTGATGFIGKRLIHELLEQGHEIYALMRIKGIGMKILENPRFHIIYGDARDPSKMDPFPQDLDAAYYLIHSMGSVSQNIITVEMEISHNFISAIEKTSCKQIIFLGGIIEEEINLSPHLRSRLAVENVLKTSKVPCTILRSSIIIGSGSASFEIIRDLVQRLPVMIAPKWVRSLCQPISIKDVLFYLSGVLLNPLCFGKTYDIGGPQVISFKDVLLEYAHFKKLKRYIFDVPLLTPRLSSYWLVFITSVRFSICKQLVESMKQNTRKLNSDIDIVLPHTCLSYDEALNLVFEETAQNKVTSSWVDDWALKETSPDIQDFLAIPQKECLKDIKNISITIPLEEVQRRIWCIGGMQGWYSMNWAWRLRGFIDKLAGGTGFNRGRRDPCKLYVGDSINFWRVVLADEEKGHLILYAEMKLPGKAWLEFKINKEERLFTQTATFQPNGFLGYLYWYFSLPFHCIIFNNMAKAIAQKQ